MSSSPFNMNFDGAPPTQVRHQACSQDSLGDSLSEHPVEGCEVFMALDMKPNGSIGCAYFTVATATLFLQEDTRINGFELVESLLFQEQPTSVIIPSRAPENFADFLDRQSREGIGQVCEGREAGGFTLHSAASSEFNTEVGKRALARLSCLGSTKSDCALFTTAVRDIEPDAGQDAEQDTYHGDRTPVSGPQDRSSEHITAMRLGTIVNLDNHAALGCAGALLYELERKKAAASPGGAVEFEIRSVVTVTYAQCMFVSADTLLALGIFRPPFQGQGSRAGMDKSTVASSRRSIFDLFSSYILTVQGRRRLREIFIRPSIDLQVIESRQRSICSLCLPENRTTVAAIRRALKKIRNIRPLLLHLRKGLSLPGSFASIKLSAWVNLLNFCASVLQIMALGQQMLCGECDIVDRALDMMEPDALFGVKEALTRTIDFEKSQSAGCNVVASRVSHELDGLKFTYGNLQARLKSVCDSFRSELPRESQQGIVGCIFHPELGYLLVAVAALQGQTLHRPGRSSGSSSEYPADAWEEVLRDDGLVYLKTSELRGVDSEFGDLTGRIIELEVGIFHDLGSALLGQENALLRASDAVGDVDSILALAAGAETLRLNRPKMTLRNVLHVRQGRHLLRDSEVADFVPNDCALAGGLGDCSDAVGDDDPSMESMERDAPSTVVVTGPNHSGKSVYLKQVATILYLAHIGSFVPAESATIGITDRILTRIATRESISRAESAFGVDLRQAAFSINFATRRSLVLLDEFGKGTAPVDGAALFDSLLGHFLGLGPENMPKVLAATHFHEIFDRSSFQQHPRLGLVHMSVVLNPDASLPGEKIRFLHRLQEGRSAKSFGRHCAAISGVDSAVVERAGQIADFLAQGMTLDKLCITHRARDDIEGLRQNEHRVRQFLEEMAEVLDEHSVRKPPRHLLRLVFGRCENVE